MSSQSNVVKSKYSNYQLPEIPACQYVAEQIANYDPHMIALIDSENGTKFTYGELHNRIQEVACGLVKVGLTKRDLVLFFGDNSIQYALSMLATIYLGVTISPLTPANGPFEVAHQLSNSKGTVLVIDRDRLLILVKILAHPEYNRAINHIKLLIVMNDVQVDASVAQHPLIPQGLFTYEEIYSIGSGRTLLQIPYYKTTIEDYFMIVYTSGTTGLPKGAIHSQYSMLTILVYMREPPEMVGWKSAFIWPLGHISGSLFIVRCFVSGMAPVIFRRNVLDETLAKVDRYKIDQLIITPAHAVPLVINDYEYDLTSLKLIIFGGSKIPVQLKEQIYDKFKAPVIEYYGATEMMSGVLIKSYWTADCPPGSVGYVIGDNELKIVSLDTGESLAAMEQGEICMRGPTRFVGYLDNTEATRDTIDSDGWYHSGDVGYYDHSGALFVVDRIKEIIKYKHWTIFPSEIEIFLSRHKTIEAACVVGVKHATDGELVRAYVQLKPTYSDTTKEDISNYVQNNLGFQKQLRGGVYFVEELPRISIGKVDRKYFKNLIKEELITEVIE